MIATQESSICTPQTQSSLPAPSVKDALEFIKTFPSWRRVSNCADEEGLGRSLLYSKRNNGLFYCQSPSGEILCVGAGVPTAYSDPGVFYVNYVFSKSMRALRAMWKQFQHVYPHWVIETCRHDRQKIYNLDLQYKIIYGR